MSKDPLTFSHWHYPDKQVSYDRTLVNLNRRFLQRKLMLKELVDGLKEIQPKWDDLRQCAGMIFTSVYADSNWITISCHTNIPFSSFICERQQNTNVSLNATENKTQKRKQASTERKVSKA